MGTWWAHLGLGEAEVRLELTHIAKLLLCISRRDRRRHNHIITRLPVNWSHDALLVTRLQGINDTENLRRVTSGRCWVHHGEADLLAGVDDKDRTDGERNALLGNVVQIPLVDHVIQERNLALSISDDGELEVRRGDFVDIVDPFAVGAEVVGALKHTVVSLDNETGQTAQNIFTYKTNHLDIALLEFILQGSKGTKLRGANRREVRGVGEEDGPAVADELVEVNVAMCGLGCEIRGYNKIVSITHQ